MQLDPIVSTEVPVTIYQSSKQSPSRVAIFVVTYKGMQWFMFCCTEPHDIVAFVGMRVGFWDD